MDTFRIIGDVMPDVPAPAQETVAAARAGMLRARRRFPLRTGIAVAAAATVAVIGTAVAVPRPGDGTAVTAAVPSPGEVLGEVADRLARREEPERVSWRVETELVDRSPFTGDVLAGDAFTVENRSIEVRWAGPYGATVTQATPIGAGPFTAADRAKWRKMGSPRICGTDSECGNDQYDRIPYGRTRYTPGPPADYDVFGLRLGMRELRGLPRDPKGLRTEIVSRWAPVLESAGGRGGEAPAPVPTFSQDDVVWQVGWELLAEVPATPETRAAVLRMLAATPGARLADGLRDAAGRAGLAITRASMAPGLETRILIDRDTGDPLASELVDTAAGPQDPPAGSAYSSRLVRRIGWTDEVPVLPEGCTAQRDDLCLR
ncbi:CU044_5270 family protein [Planobispora takensis]|uniref:CU044_5270 family protein n=1 Tax=Planobispora takensis TaxID=1367882 RepID=A0A8J3T2J7_9ACTN|nr:CU044_5270 family protein [Planobispora takensis]GII02880.1 hypothetical protein Pta02_48880 [Planobispora takensis]